MTEIRLRRTEFESRTAGVTGKHVAMHPDVLAVLANDVRDGLGSTPKSLPSRWLYEGAGSELFDSITELDEYYPTRSERAILSEHAADIVLLSGASQVIELGSGTSEKTKLLLDAFDEVNRLRSFTAMDAAAQTLQESVTQLAVQYPRTDVSGVVADFNDAPERVPPGPERLLVFLGGTIGNLTPADRGQLLAGFAGLLDVGEHLLLGTDLVKDPSRLLAAYDDSLGITAAFEKNILAVINENLGASFDADLFEYVARWNPQSETIEMSLRSLEVQDTEIRDLDLTVHFDRDEEVRTEISAKFHLEGVTKELSSAGFDVVRQWTDGPGDFAVSLAQKTSGRTVIRRTQETERADSPSNDSLTPSIESYRAVRAATEALAQALTAEDQTIQSMPDVSPTKWHLGHVTWFFEQFALMPHNPGYRAMDDHYLYLFNSYYESVGRRHARGERGLLSRPGVVEIATYREVVDDAMAQRFESGLAPDASALVELGLHHEQQHQELILMDIKHVLGVHPFSPRYSPVEVVAPHLLTSESVGWVTHPGGLVEIGAHRPSDSTGAMDFSHGFVFDNESPRHTVWLESFAIADRLVTAGEWLEFMEDDGYRRADLWLADGWAVNQAEHREAPLYWSRGSDGWGVFTLYGRNPVRLDEPVVHVSYFEADAFARWAGVRLPTEAEWEVLAAAAPAPECNAIALHPRSAQRAQFQGELRQLYGEAWQWTSSAYLPYPRFEPLKGSVGEYNGKFMVNQHVLRGSSAVTPPGHARPTYRNFFPPGARWPFTGVRLAKDN
ncbi:MAG: ergothioneine biosynthesis protein EgtB [Acidimicrobiales bacterium]